MWEFLSSPAAQVVVWVSALLILLAICYFGLRSFRDRTDENGSGPQEWLDNFHEMHMEGDITEPEFRQVKRALDTQAKVPAEVDEAEQEDPAGHDDCDHPGDGDQL